MIEERKDKETLSTEKRDILQYDLIYSICGNMEVSEKRNKIAQEWIQKFADNIDQLDPNLVDEYFEAKRIGDEKQQKELLLKIQKSLEELDQKYG